MRLFHMVHKAGPNPGHAVEGRSERTVCDLSTEGMDLARGLVNAENFAQVTRNSVIAGCCIECEASVGRVAIAELRAQIEALNRSLEAALEHEDAPVALDEQWLSQQSPQAAAFLRGMMEYLNSPLSIGATLIPKDGT